MGYFCVELGDLSICVKSRYSKTREYYQGFLTDKQAIDFISVSKEEIQALPRGSDFQRENSCLRLKLLELLQRRGRILLHSVLVVLDGNAYLFLASSGTGKSTHAMQWLEVFGERAYILNGDKPLVGFDELGQLIAYGTPWKGKEGYGTNGSAPVAGLCFLERGEENDIWRLPQNEIVPRLFQQTVVPKQQPELGCFMQVMNRIVKEVPCYLLRCNISHEAAKIAYEGMKNDESKI